MHLRRRQQVCHAPPCIRSRPNMQNKRKRKQLTRTLSEKMRLYMCALVCGGQLPHLMLLPHIFNNPKLSSFFAEKWIKTKICKKNIANRQSKANKYTKCCYWFCAPQTLNETRVDCMTYWLTRALTAWPTCSQPFHTCCNVLIGAHAGMSVCLYVCVRACMTVRLRCQPPFNYECACKIYAWECACIRQPATCETRATTAITSAH